jgi:hypothetical protein
LSPAEVPNLDKAKANVEEFARELLARLAAELEGGEKGTEETVELAGAG